MRTALIASFAVAITTLVACTEEVEAPREVPAELDSLKADGVDHDNWTYFVVTRQDYRKCMAPMCGGVYVKRVNQPEVKCADGKWAKECYVGGFDFAAIGYSSDEAADAQAAITSGRAIFRGAIVTGHWADFGEVPAFAATEVWTAATDAKPKNVFYRVHDLGIMCITSPCASFDGLRLNRNLDPLKRYAQLDFEKSDANDDTIAKAWEVMRADEIVVAAKEFEFDGLRATGLGLAINQFYFPKYAAQAPGVGDACGGRAGPCENEALYCQFNDSWCGMADGQGTCQVRPEVCSKELFPVCGCDGVTYDNDCFRQLAGAGFGTPGACEKPVTCVTAGCSGELCVEEGSDGGFSACMWREEFACFQQHGVCEAQADGACGWSPSAELDQCLADFE